jgi:hypothetical protein
MRRRLRYGMRRPVRYGMRRPVHCGMCGVFGKATRTVDFLRIRCEFTTQKQ